MVFAYSWDHPLYGAEGSMFFRDIEVNFRIVSYIIGVRF